MLVELNPFKLYAPTQYWKMLAENSAELKEICNGVGSKTSWTYHLTPDTIWGIDIKPAANIHDFQYTYPKTFPAVVDGEDYFTGLDYKNHADRVFLNNMIRIFEYYESIPGIKGWFHRRLSGVRRARAYEYYVILQKFGATSFWSGKEQAQNIIS